MLASIDADRAEYVQPAVGAPSAHGGEGRFGPTATEPELADAGRSSQLAVPLGVRNHPRVFRNYVAAANAGPRCALQPLPGETGSLQLAGDHEFPGGAADSKTCRWSGTDRQRDRSGAQ